MSKKVISKEEIEKIAKLSDLDVSGDEERLSELLSETVEYIENLNELDTSNVKETYQVTGLINIFQKGQEYTLTQEEALSNAKQTYEGLIETKPVFNR